MDLFEAFVNLDRLNEQDFDTDKEGIEELSDFMADDNTEDAIEIIDPNIEEDGDLADSYVGKIVIQCDTCNSLIYKDADEITWDDASDLVNVDEECPVCKAMNGFIVIGQIQEYQKEEDIEDEEEFDVEDEEEVDTIEKDGEDEIEDEEEVEVEDEDEDKDEVKKESFKRFRREKKLPESLIRARGSKRQLHESTSVSESELGKFIDDAVKDLRADPESGTTWYKYLDGELGIAVGWAEGFDTETGYEVCAKICNLNSDSMHDYEFLVMPYDPKTGEVWDSEVSSPSSSDASWFISTLKDIRDAVDNGALVTEGISKKSVRNRKLVKESVNESLKKRVNKKPANRSKYVNPISRKRKGAVVSESVNKRHYIGKPLAESKVNKRPAKLRERLGQYDPQSWSDEDIALHKSIDWAARNYDEYPVEDDYIMSKAYLYGTDGNKVVDNVKFVKKLRANPIYPPYYGTEDFQPFKGYTNGMYDGHKHGIYYIMDRFEDWETNRMMSEDVKVDKKSPVANALASHMGEFRNIADVDALKKSIKSVLKSSELSAKDQTSALHKLLAPKTTAEVLNVLNSYIVSSKEENYKNFNEKSFLKRKLKKQFMLFQKKFMKT